MTPKYQLFGSYIYSKKMLVAKWNDFMSPSPSAEIMEIDLPAFREGTINMFRGGGCANLALCDKRCIPLLTFINCIQTPPPKIFHINGDPPYILELFLLPIVQCSCIVHTLPNCDQMCSDPPYNFPHQW